MVETALHRQRLSIDHGMFEQLLATTENLLIIQDLDGVCMGLVKDPLTRVMDLGYVEAVPKFEGHFFVLTNGEHIGQRGVQGIVERTVGDRASVQEKGLYLPGLGAGGVQWQDRYGQVSYPGVSEAELAFLAEVPQRIEQQMQQFLSEQMPDLSAEDQQHCLASSVLDNAASPTANLNTFYELLEGQTELFQRLQKSMQALMEALMAEAAERGLADSFFVHYAPNLGRSPQGGEIVWFADQGSSGTTDFQFMLRGAVKEAGVLALLNRYYFARTGQYPLGVNFNARQAPKEMDDLLLLVKQNFDPALMPLMVGIGDTVTSQGVTSNEGLEFKRGGSDRNFLQLLQNIGQAFDSGSLTVYIDSSGGELKNRQAVRLETGADGVPTVVEGPGDPRDSADPLTLNLVFPGGYRQYCQTFQAAAKRRAAG